MDKDSIAKHLDKLYNKLRIATNDFDYFLIQADIDYYEGLLMNIGEEEK